MVKIVTESTADIPTNMATELGIHVVPSYVVFGTETYRDGIELTGQEFYEKLSVTRTIPTTATPPPAIYEEVYRQLAREPGGIVSIHLAASLSGLYDSAAAAARNVSDVRIEVVDSEQVTMGYGWMVVAAAEAARRGESLDDIVTLVEEMKDRTHVLAVLDTLDFLYRGGRVGWASALVGALMRIKPIVDARRGEVVLLERTRTQSRAIDRLVDLILALGPLERGIVLHTDAPSLAERVADRLQTHMPDWKRMIAQAGVTIASHTGPGAVGVACVTTA